MSLSVSFSSVTRTSLVTDFSNVSDVTAGAFYDVRLVSITILLA